MRMSGFSGFTRSSAAEDSALEHFACDSCLALVS